MTDTAKHFIESISFAFVLVSLFTILFVWLSESMIKKKNLEIETLKRIQGLMSKAKANEENLKQESDADRGDRKLELLDIVDRRNEKVNSGSSKVDSEDRSLTNFEFVGDLIKGYHQQALSQAKVQFWLSVVAAIVGFLYIIISSLRNSDAGLTTVLNAIPGAIIDAVAFLFFKQSEQTRERATALYDRLRADNKFESIKSLVDSIDEGKMKSLVKAQIALYMAGLTPKEIDMQSIEKN